MFVLIAMQTIASVFKLHFMIMIIIIVIFKCYISRERIALSYKNGVDIELGKSNRLIALRMMANHT